MTVLVRVMRAAIPALLLLAAAIAPQSAAAAPAHAPRASGSCAHAGPQPGPPPGCNFDLSHWKLQTGTGSECSPGVQPSQLDGTNGFTSSEFFTDPGDGAMTMRVSPNDCLTSNSTHPRTELRQLPRGGGVSDSSNGWTFPGLHTMDIDMSVSRADSSTIISQIHPISGGGNFPLLKMFYSPSGTITVTLEASLTHGGTGTTLSGFPQEPLGARFHIQVRYQDGVVTVTVGGVSKTSGVNSSFKNPKLLNYFKTGAYIQGGGIAIVKVFSLQATN